MVGYEWLLTLIIPILVIWWVWRSLSRRKNVTKIDVPDAFQGIVRDDNMEIHGMTQGDFHDGHVCGRCWEYTRDPDEYEHAVLVTHGVKMKSNRESKSETR